ncbi:hypothetical protein NP233_g6295 [Leucocoprinus birnbaumii]|uniref:Uncharacterized protein n=1 Tax=Leucocoprinus birnbaumii TaxID=56174 RepID=A0AAD5VR84_9AGAR|nr:hypothetical protein NP233_g6295 [Leucocoprinus birnbaumii]
MRRLRTLPSLVWATAFLCLTLLLVSQLAVNEDFRASAAGRAPNRTGKDFYWVDLKPSHDLVWHPCYKPLRRECARLLVPLNHLHHSDQSSGHAAIALIRIPSPLLSPAARPHPRYCGPILFNPGGPGGSGVDFLNSTGDLLAQIIGDEFDLYHFTIPVGRGERELWMRNPGLSVIRGGVADPFRDIEGEGGSSLESEWAHVITSNVLAGERGGKWLGNVNTEQTAYDMLSIVNAYGKDKLMYWGFSYGTVLGSTFASLFPDKVERIVLDGVVDADNYYATLWSNNLLDTDQTMNLFYETCHAAGSACPFWAPSPALIAANLTRIYKDVIAKPIPVRSSTSYGVLDFTRVRLSVFIALYSPWASWPTLAQALSELGGPKRDPEPMWRRHEIPTFRCACSGTCKDKDALEKELEGSIPDAQAAIKCTDGLDIPSDLASARRYFNDMSEESEWSAIWSSIRLSCSGWPKTRKGYQGPVGGNTSFPLLFIGNTADPVTPVAHARTMSKRFPSSRVLTQDSPGHCSINAPSVCTMAHVREYFLTGKLPPEGTVCPVDSSPFPDVELASGSEGNTEHVVGHSEDSMTAFIEDSVRLGSPLILREY